MIQRSKYIEFTVPLLKSQFQKNRIFKSGLVSYCKTNDIVSGTSVLINIKCVSYGKCLPIFASEFDPI